MARLDAQAVRTAYRRQAATYDWVFGRVSRQARLRAVAAVNALPGTDVLEVGVGTGLALPHYSRDKRVTGIDLSADMLSRARARVATEGLLHVEALLELDAEDTGLPEARFDIAAVMFVASVVPHPRALVAELRRLVRPGGDILFVSHFIADGGPRLAVERAMASFSQTLGWHPDFAKSDLFDEAEQRDAIYTPLPPLGLFTLVHLRR
jgi:phosphatidylethanolamine/phosphatidyl-N-methylethanolamine N-methyltransferase